MKFFIGQRVLVIGTFRFLRPNTFFDFFCDLVQAFPGSFARKLLLKNESLIFSSQNGKYEILYGVKNESVILRSLSFFNPYFLILS